MKIFNIKFVSSALLIGFVSFSSCTKDGLEVYSEDIIVYDTTDQDTDPDSEPDTVIIAEDEDTSTDLACPASGEFEDNTTRNVDVPNPANAGEVDDRSCYSDYSESIIDGTTGESTILLMGLITGIRQAPYNHE